LPPQPLCATMMATVTSTTLTGGLAVSIHPDQTAVVRIAAPHAQKSEHVKCTMSCVERLSLGLLCTLGYSNRQEERSSGSLDE
jgi:hypothetical protein